MSKKIVLVVGSGRSGTSLVMQALEAVGCYIPADRVPHSSANQAGTGEDIYVRELMTKAWKQLDTFSSFRPNNWADRISIAEIQKDMNEYIERAIMEAGSRPLAIKIPTASLFIPMWMKAARINDCQFGCIWALRHSEAVVTSFIKAYDTAPKLAVQRILQRNYYVIRDAPDDTVILRYEDWTKDANKNMGLILRAASSGTENILENISAPFDKQLSHRPKIKLSSETIRIINDLKEAFDNHIAPHWTNLSEFKNAEFDIRLALANKLLSSDITARKITEHYKLEKYEDCKLGYFIERSEVPSIEINLENIQSQNLIPEERVLELLDNLQREQESKRSSLEHRISRAEGKRAQLMAQVENLNKKIADKDRKISEYRQQLENIFVRIVWRLTAPLRIVARLVKRAIER